MVIWKYDILPMVWHNMPIGAKILDIQRQGDKTQMWALVDPNAQTESRCFLVYGTGHTIKSNHDEYIASFQVPECNLMFHVFERKAV